MLMALQMFIRSTKTAFLPILCYAFGLISNYKLKIKNKMTTDEMLLEIVNYKYKSYGFPYVFMDYSQSNKVWTITWRNPAEFSNEKQTEGSTPNESCRKALEFIINNPHIFCRSSQADA